MSAENRSGRRAGIGTTARPTDQLGQPHDAGVLSDEESAAAKAKLLNV